MDSKGQAYSAFKLMIAAVVALAILGILMGILQTLPNMTQSQPSPAAIDLIKQAKNQYATPLVKAVTFSSKDKIINGKTVAGSSGGLSQDQICMSLGDAPENDSSGFSLIAGSKNHIIQYNGSTNKDMEIVVICDRTLDELDEDLTNFNYDMPSECGGDMCETGTCCAIILKS